MQFCTQTTTPLKNLHRGEGRVSHSRLTCILYLHSICVPQCTLHSALYCINWHSRARGVLLLKNSFEFRDDIIVLQDKDRKKNSDEWFYCCLRLEFFLHMNNRQMHGRIIWAIMRKEWKVFFSRIFRNRVIDLEPGSDTSGGYPGNPGTRWKH